METFVFLKGKCSKTNSVDSTVSDRFVLPLHVQGGFVFKIFAFQFVFGFYPFTQSWGIPEAFMMTASSYRI